MLWLQDEIQGIWQPRNPFQNKHFHQCLQGIYSPDPLPCRASDLRTKICSFRTDCVNFPSSHPSRRDGTLNAKYFAVKTSHPECSPDGFTLVELLVVVAIIGILAGLLLPAISKATPRARQVLCASNLRQIGIAFHAFAHDHQNRFPQTVPMSEGGALEFNRQSPGFGGIYLVNPQAFRAVSNELGSTHVLICPSGPQSKAPSFARLGFTNLSFFVHTATSLDQPQSVLGGDNNLIRLTSRPDNSAVSTGPGPASEYGWSPDRHSSRGNVLLADASVDQRRSLPAQAPFGRPSVSTSRTPTLQPSSPQNEARSVGLPASAPSGVNEPRGVVSSASAVSPASIRGGATPPSVSQPGATSPAPSIVQEPIPSPVDPADRVPAGALLRRSEDPSIPWWIWLLVALAVAIGLEIRRRLKASNAKRAPV